MRMRRCHHDTQGSLPGQANRELLGDGGTKGGYKLRLEAEGIGLQEQREMLTRLQRQGTGINLVMLPKRWVFTCHEPRQFETRLRGNNRFYSSSMQSGGYHVYQDDLTCGSF